jgi:hypothetical protein
VQLTTPEACEQFHPVPVAETNDVPAGSVSVTVAWHAVAGPALDTVTVYVSVPPGATGSGESSFVSDRFAPGTAYKPYWR